MQNIDCPQVWHYFQQFATIFLVPVAVALIKSERMALDNSTQGNGIAHWYKLAKQALAVIPPEEVKAVEAKIDSVAPGASQIIEAATSPNDPAAQ